MEEENYNLITEDEDLTDQNETDIDTDTSYEEEMIVNHKERNNKVKNVDMNKVHDTFNMLIKQVQIEYMIFYYVESGKFGLIKTYVDDKKKKINEIETEIKQQVGKEKLLFEIVYPYKIYWCQNTIEGITLTPFLVMVRTK